LAIQIFALRKPFLEIGRDGFVLLGLSAKQARSTSGDRMATITIHDVARAAGVSIATASRVLNGRPTVGEEIRKRVQKAVDELGYSPDILAQSMRLGRTQMIAFVIRDITVAPLASLVRATQDVLHAADHELLIACSEGERDREVDLLRRMSRRRADGLILTTSTEDDPVLVDAWKSAGLPTVMFDREAHGLCDNVLIAHSEGLRQALDHLFGLGHTRIAMLTGQPTVWPARSRVETYREEFAKRGLPVDEELLRARSFDTDTGFMEASSLLSLANPPTAIIAGGTSILPAVLRATQSRGLRVPDDISIIGDSDSDLAMLATPSITVVRWNSSDVGQTCARLILERLADLDAPPRQIIFPTEFVSRKSCAPPKA
jgi:LacI family transcriptional regulator